MLQKFAELLKDKLISERRTVTIYNVSAIEPEETLKSDALKGGNSLFLFPTVDRGLPPISASWFCKWVDEASVDFRIEKGFLTGLSYAVFGLGDSNYASNFNVVRI